MYAIHEVNKKMYRLSQQKVRFIEITLLLSISDYYTFGSLNYGVYKKKPPKPLKLTHCLDLNVVPQVHE